MDENLIQRVNDLPICEDISILDTLLGIDSNGNTYRVRKDDISGGGKKLLITHDQFQKAVVSPSSVSDQVSAFGVGGVGDTKYYYNLSEDEVSLLKEGGKVYCIAYYDTGERFQESCSSIGVIPKDSTLTVVYGLDVAEVIIILQQPEDKSVEDILGSLASFGATIPCIEVVSTGACINVYFESNSIFETLTPAIPFNNE